jgi:hypothetical protein
MSWADKLSDDLDELDIAADVYTVNGRKFVEFEGGYRKAVEVSRWGNTFNFAMKEWDATGGIISETDLRSTDNEDELVDIATSLYSEFE